MEDASYENNFYFNESPGQKKVTSSTNLTKFKKKQSRQNRISFNSEDHGKNIVDFNGESITFTQLLVKV